MSLLRKTLVAALFLLLSAAAFAALIKPVIFGLAAFYEHQSFNPPTGLWMATSEVIALALGTALTAAAFLLVGFIIKRCRALR